MKPPVFKMTGFPTATVRIVSGDAADDFPTAYLVNGTRRVMAATITIEGNNMRYAFGGAVPTNGANPLGHLIYVGQGLRVENPQALVGFQYVNAVAGNNAVMQVTFEFEA